MSNQPDYILYRPAAPVLTGTRPSGEAASDKVYPLTPGVWQQEAVDTLKLYADKEAGFSPVSAQLELFPSEATTKTQVTQEVQAPRTDPSQLIPHWMNFKFLSEDTKRLAAKIRDLYMPGFGEDAPVRPGEKLKQTCPVGDQPIYNERTKEFKADQFPDRLIYKDGGLYPANDLEAQSNAPNYRKMPNKPVHGVGQPTKQGFRDVIKHMDGKPTIWTNTRAEAIIYLEGKPYNLRQIAGMENVDLKKGASGDEVEALEQRLKGELIGKTITVAEEVVVKGPDGKPVMENGRQKTERVTREVKVTAENCQTTQDVVKELQAENPNFEYRRIPLSDEKSPDPASLDKIRDYMNEMSAKYGKDADPQFVFNCHQGKGRTTTSMVTAGITLDGREPQQLELPFDEARERTERNIRDNAQLQNLNTTVDDYKKKAESAEAKAKDLDKRAAEATTRGERADLGAQARRAHADADKYRENAQEFTKRYALMQKYSEYVNQYGSNSQHPTFETWMKKDEQQADLNQKWAALNQQCGLAQPDGPFYEPQTMAA
jgi:hypothetical protein